MDIVRSVINRMDLLSVFIVSIVLLALVAIVGGFMTANANRDANQRVMQSIVSGCATANTDDYAKCVADAAKAAGVSADKGMKQYVVDMCFGHNSGPAKEECVSRVSDALGLES